MHQYATWVLQKLENFRQFWGKCLALFFCVHVDFCIHACMYIFFVSFQIWPSGSCSSNSILFVGVFFPHWNTLSRRYCIANNLNYHSNGHINAVSNGMIFPQGLSMMFAITLMFCTLFYFRVFIFLSSLLSLSSLIHQFLSQHKSFIVYYMISMKAQTLRLKSYFSSEVT